jgi:outer membrane receptor protein involved in Fe transport
MRTKWSRTLLSALVLATFALLPRVLYGQQDAGTLKVLAEDSSGAVLPGATVTLTNANTNTSIAQVTNEAGYATFSPLQRGSYVVEVSLAGFKSVKVTKVEMDVNQNRLVRVALEVATVTETVEVSADSAPIQTEDASLGQVVKGNVIVELPLAARRYTDLTLLTPGATESTLDANIRGPGWLVVNGNHHSQNNFVLDGFDNNQGTTNLQSRSAQVVQPSPDAFNEFKVMTNNFSAEFGRAAGAIINGSIKSGTNEVHGSAWYYNRPSKLAANSWRGNLIGAPKDELKWQQPGFTIGGPVAKSKLFYFGDYEGFFSDTSELQITQVPTEAMHNGDFSSLNFPIIDPVTGQPFSNNQIQSSRFDALGKKIIDLFPKPNLPGNVGSSGRVSENYGVQLPITDKVHKFDVRMDFYATKSDRFFGRYSFSQQRLFKEPTFPVPADTGGEDGGSQYARNQSLGFSWNRTISTSVINELRFGYNRTASSFAHAGEDGMTGTEFGFKGIPPELDEVGGIPRIEMSNYHSLGTGPWRPQYQNPDAYQITDSLSIIQGTHSLKIGFDFRHKNNEWVDLMNRTVAYSFQGRFTNDDAADLLVGFPQNFQAQSFMVAEQIQQNYSAYLQDDWKVRPNLTLNLGLRYEYATPFWGRPPNPNINLDFETGQLIIAPGRDLLLGARQGDNKYLQDRDFNNFGPRLGVAYQLKPGRMVLRGGYGVFYNGEDFHGSGGNLILNAPNTFPVTLQREGEGPPPLRLSDTIPSNVLDPSAIRSSDLFLQTRKPGYEASTVHQWNVALQFLLPSDSNLEFAYVGNRGRNLDGRIDGNRVPFGVDGSIPANRTYPQWGGLETLDSDTQSNYNALQVKFEKRLTGSWYNLTSYTYASALAESDAFAAETGGVQNIIFENGIPRGDWRAERGFNNQSSRQRLSMANVWQVPIGRNRKLGANMSRALDFVIGGWQSSFIATIKSGLPVNVSLSESGNDPITGQPFEYLPGSGGGSLRPNRVGKPNTSIDPTEDRLHFLDVNAFSLPIINTPGNAARNVAWGPGFFNIDLGVTKRFPVSERMYFDFRFEMFNTFNHTNFKNPDGRWDSSNFGVVNDAFGPRQMQIAVRFAF